MSILALTFAASSGHISPIIPIAMVVIGVILFLVGFFKYREYRVLADTPQIPIRSVCHGTVPRCRDEHRRPAVNQPANASPVLLLRSESGKEGKEGQSGNVGRNPQGEGGSSLLPARRNRIYSGKSGKG